MSVAELLFAALGLPMQYIVACLHCTVVAMLLSITTTTALLRRAPKQQDRFIDWFSESPNTVVVNPLLWHTVKASTWTGQHMYMHGRSLEEASAGDEGACAGRGGDLVATSWFPAMSSQRP